MEISKILGGTLVSYLNISVSTITNLVLVPMYIFYLGDEQYGLWLIVLTLVSYLGFSHLGIGQSISNFVARANATKDYSLIETGVSTAFWLYFAIVLPLVCAVAISVNLGIFKNFIQISENLAPIFESVILISSVLFLFKLPLTVFGASLRALNLIYLEQSLSLFFSVVQFLGVLFVLKFGHGIVGLSMVYGGTGILLGFTTFFYLKNKIPRLSIAPHKYSQTLALNLLKPGGYFFLLQISGALIAGLDNIVIGSYLGAKDVVPFAVAMKLCFLAMSMISVITSNLLPSITRAFARENYQELQRIYLTLLQICFGMGLLILINMISVGPDFIDIWVGRDSYVGDFCFYLILCHLLLNTILWPADAVIIGTSKHKTYALVTVIEGIINVVLSIFWVQIWGVAGVISATIFARVSSSFWFMIRKSAEITGVSVLKTFEKTFSPFMLPLIGSLLVIFLLNQLDFEGISKVILHAILITSVYIWLVLYVSLDSNSREKVINKVKFIVKR